MKKKSPEERGKRQERDDSSSYEKSISTEKNLMMLKKREGGWFVRDALCAASVRRGNADAARESRGRKDRGDVKTDDKTPTEGRDVRFAGVAAGRRDAF